jgi:hypothetical protein
MTMVFVLCGMGVVRARELCAELDSTHPASASFPLPSE